MMLQLGPNLDKAYKLIALKHNNDKILVNQRWYKYEISTANLMEFISSADLTYMRRIKQPATKSWVMQPFLLLLNRIMARGIFIDTLV